MSTAFLRLFGQQQARLAELMFPGLIVACLFAGPPTGMAAPAATVLDKATDDFNLGVGLYRSSRWQLAADTFRQFLKEFPEHPRHNLARLYFGLSLSSLEKYEEARVEFAAYVDAEPDSPQTADARYRLGECSYYLRDYAAAITQLNAYLQKHPQHALNDWAIVFLGDSYLAVNQADQAEAILRPLVKKPPTAALLRDAQFALARAVEASPQPDAAIELYRTVAADQESALAPRALAKIGTWHFNRNQFAEAVQAYDEIVTRFPNNAIADSARLNGGIALFRSGRFEPAIEHFREVGKNTPHAAQAMLMTALCLKDLGRADEARASFTNALAEAGTSPIAADILFQRAQLERVENKTEIAAQIFEDIADRWPADPRVAECLFNAADLRLELNDPASTERLWKRLADEFPKQSAGTREQVLLGRLLLSQKKAEPAAEIFSQAVSRAPADTSPRILAVARYYLVRASFDAGRHADVIAQTRQLQSVLQAKEMQDLRSALALAAISGLQTGDYASTKVFADLFIPGADDENQKADVIAARTVAQTHLKQYEPAIADGRLLADKYSVRGQTWSAILQAADAAAKEQAHPEATAFFELAAGATADDRVREAGLTGVAWSWFRRTDFGKAESAFQAVVKAFPESPDRPQALYMEARCIEEQRDVSRAVTRYQAVFTALVDPANPAAAGAETQPPLQYAYDAGRQAARMLSQLKQAEQADQQWNRLVSSFPAARDLDRVLDEWALSNLTSERFDQADEIYRRLLKQFPDSPFAGQARLSLAESEMQAQRLDVALKEFEAIVAEARYGPSEKERALFHVIDIHTSRREWQQVRRDAAGFLETYRDSELEPQVRLLSAESILNTVQAETDVAQARQQLQTLRESILAGSVPTEEWTERVWIVLAEAALLARDYAQIDVLADELVRRNPKSRFQFQMHDVQGRRWKNQAPPDFAKAREAFRRVLDDETARGTETAARCQFLIAETWVLEKKYEDARREYLRTYVSYPWEAWQVQALYQAAGCEIQLSLRDAAISSYQELISRFPRSELAGRARERLSELGVTAP